MLCRMPLFFVREVDVAYITDSIENRLILVPAEIGLRFLTSMITAASALKRLDPVHAHKTDVALALLLEQAQNESACCSASGPLSAASPWH